MTNIVVNSPLAKPLKIPFLILPKLSHMIEHVYFQHHYSHIERLAQAQAQSPSPSPKEALGKSLSLN